MESIFCLVWRESSFWNEAQSLMFICRLTPRLLPVGHIFCRSRHLNPKTEMPVASCRSVAGRDILSNLKKKKNFSWWYMNGCRHILFNVISRPGTGKCRDRSAKAQMSRKARNEVLCRDRQVAKVIATGPMTPCKALGSYQMKFSQLTLTRTNSHPGLDIKRLSRS